MGRLLILLVLLTTVTGWAQTPTPSPSPEATVTPAPQVTPHTAETNADPLGLSALRLPFEGPRDETRAKLRGPFSGRHLFTISGAEGYTARARAEKIVNRVRRVASDQGDDASLVTTAHYGEGVLTLTANDRVLATVTPDDLDVIEPYALPTETLRSMEMEVAEEWRRQLQRELDFAAYIKRPEYLRVAIPLGLLALVLAFVAHTRLRRTKLRRLGTSVWGLEILLWGGVIVFNLWLFPSTKELARWIHETLISPFFRVWLVFLVATILTNLLEAVIDRYFTMLRQEPDIRPRQAQRLETFASVACRTVRGLMMVLVLFTILSMLPFDFLPLITGAGVVGIAMGLAAQDFLKDILAGIGILIEDRFGVGDWIEWDKYSGSVETVNLHYTQIRTVHGGLVHIPNSDLRVVNNLSNEWAQVDFRVRVAYGSDLDRAIATLEEEAQQLAGDLSDQVLGEPVSKGVQELGAHGVSLRLFLRTKPLLQWDIERELNRRVKLRFQKEGIEIPFPQTSIWMRGSGAPPVKGEDRKDSEGDTPASFIHED